jgi:hypothetical protein
MREMMKCFSLPVQAFERLDETIIGGIAEYEILHEILP